MEGSNNSSWTTRKLVDLSTDISSGARVNTRPNPMYKSALWVSFWLWFLSAGDPDILDQVVKILGNFA